MARILQKQVFADVSYTPSISSKESVSSAVSEVQVSSSFVLPDSSALRYHLEGNTSPDSPVLVFINDALMNSQIWEPAFALFKELCPQYRLLRYGECIRAVYRVLLTSADIRGYAADSIGTADSITLALVVSDLKLLLEYLLISHVHAIVGVGFGANIGLALLAEQPSISSSFVAIGSAITDSPAISRKKEFDDWELRLNIARRVGMGSTANKAVSRWFTADARDSDEWVRIREIVVAGDVEAMGKGSNAVLESVGHDTEHNEQRGRKMLEGLGVPALFICGAGDGVLPEEMETYPSMMRKAKGTFTLIARACRLVCCERPQEFVNILRSWLDDIH